MKPGSPPRIIQRRSNPIPVPMKAGAAKNRLKNHDWMPGPWEKIGRQIAVNAKQMPTTTIAAASLTLRPWHIWPV
jgi:hypothetical protein